MISIFSSAPLIIVTFAILIIKYSESIIALLILGTLQNIKSIINIDFDPGINISVIIFSSLFILILLKSRRINFQFSLTNSLLISFLIILLSSALIFDLNILSTKNIFVFFASIFLPFIYYSCFKHSLNSYKKLIKYILYICIAVTIVISPVAYEYLYLRQFLTYDDSWRIKYEQSSGVVILQSLYLAKVTGLLVIFLFFDLSIYQKTRLMKFFTFLLLIWTILIMALINQRMPLIATVISPLLFIFYMKYFTNGNLLKLFSKVKLNIIIVILILIILIFYFVVSAYSFRFADITFSSHRITIFLNYIENFQLSYLLTGHGYGYSTLMSESSSVHNLSLEILMDFGLITLLLYYALVFITIYRSHQIITGKGIDIAKKRVILILLNIFLYFYVLSQFSGNLESNYNQFIAMILIFSIYSMQERNYFSN